MLILYLDPVSNNLHVPKNLTVLLKKQGKYKKILFSKFIFDLKNIVLECLNLKIKALRFFEVGNYLPRDVGYSAVTVWETWYITWRISSSIITLANQVFA